MSSQNRKEKVAILLENEGYIKKLLNLFRMCEDIENSQGLHHLYEIFKNIFLLNKNALFEVMFAGKYKRRRRRRKEKVIIYHNVYFDIF